jgi:hypothetical protein
MVLRGIAHLNGDDILGVFLFTAHGAQGRYCQGPKTVTCFGRGYGLNLAVDWGVDLQGRSVPTLAQWLYLLDAFPRSKITPKMCNGELIRLRGIEIHSDLVYERRHISSQILDWIVLHLFPSNSPMQTTLS